jgi:mRNA interferase RelE/StbE
VPEYTITFATSARHELQRLPLKLARRILARIEALAQEPRPSGCKKLQGSSLLWRIRIGDYRVVYEVDDQPAMVNIVAARHRSDAYR